MTSVSPTAIAELERQVRHALATGDDSGLDVLGYGEISTVVSFDGHACKRLPPFPSNDAYAQYAETFHTYLHALRLRGCDAAASELHPHDNEDGTLSVWCVQPLEDPRSLLPAVLAGVGDPSPCFELVVECVRSVIDGRVGIDAQASNWVLRDENLAYIDVTTPLLRDAHGSELLDTDLFIASLPWALRGAVRKLVLRSILDKYYDPRSALLDFAGNLIKEALAAQVPAFLDVANGTLTSPITVGEATEYYAADARMWGALQRLRRADRWWQRTVRKRPYPFLLPGSIDRRA